MAPKPNDEPSLYLLYKVYARTRMAQCGDSNTILQTKFYHAFLAHSSSIIAKTYSKVATFIFFY